MQICMHAASPATGRCAIRWNCAALMGVGGIPLCSCWPARGKTAYQALHVLFISSNIVRAHTKLSIISPSNTQQYTNCLSGGAVCSASLVEQLRGLCSMPADGVLGGCCLLDKSLATPCPLRCSSCPRSWGVSSALLCPCRPCSAHCRAVLTAFISCPGVARK